MPLPRRLFVRLVCACDRVNSRATLRTDVGHETALVASAAMNRFDRGRQNSNFWFFVSHFVYSPPPRMVFASSAGQLKS
jgi:hypothetical protein